MTKLRPILLVEDNVDDVELALLALKQNHVANEIVVARHGGEALDYVHRRGIFKNRENGAPVVIFLDLKMPMVDGLDVLRQIKGDETHKTIPIVVLTASREEADVVKSYRLGMDAYVVKPLGFPQFTDAIQQLGMSMDLFTQPAPAKG